MFLVLKEFLSKKLVWIVLWGICLITLVTLENIKLSSHRSILKDYTTNNTSVDITVNSIRECNFYVQTKSLLIDCLP